MMVLILIVILNVGINMKLYAVEKSNDEGYYQIVGVFDSKDKAEQFIIGFLFDSNFYQITELELNKGII